MNDILKIEHTRTTRERAINRIVELTNELYNIQKQHTSKHKDQTLELKSLSIYLMITLLITMNLC